MSRSVAAATASAGLALMVLVPWAPMSRDVAGFLHVARRLLGGERLHVDVNPPQAFLLSLPPVRLADLLGLAPRIPGRRRSALPGPGAAGMRGQREHLLLRLMAPWIAARAAGIPAVGAWPVVADLLAGLGAALTPFLLAVLLVLEVWGMLRLGIRRWAAWLGPWPLAAGPRAHAVVAALLLFPAYLSDAVLRFLSPCRSVVHTGPSGILADVPWGFRVALGLAAADRLVVAPHAADAWALAGLAALGGRLLREKGWSSPTGSPRSCCWRWRGRRACVAPCS